MRPLGTLVLGLALGCGARPVAGPDTLPISLAPRVEGLDRATLGLVCELENLTPRRRRAIRAWFGASLAQSSWLDVDLTRAWQHRVILRGSHRSGPESKRAEGGTLTTTFEGPGSPPVALAGVEFDSDAQLVSALDRLGAETRRTLGEPLAAIAKDHMSAAAIVSPDERAAEACGIALDRLRDHRPLNASFSLERALERDPNCALALCLSAAVRLDLGRPDQAIERIRRIDGLESRASPATLHRAARILLIATGSYAELVAIADEEAKSRPRDPQVRLTKALGLAFLARYAEALPLLEALLPRLESSPGLLYSLAHARLATGDAEQARALLPRVEKHVPPLPAGRLAAWILFALGDHDALDSKLESLRSLRGIRGQGAEVDLIGMLAAHAILRGQDERAAKLVLEQLDRLRSMPEVLVQRGGILVEAAWILGRLGKGAACLEALAALRGKGGFAPALRAHGAIAFDLALVSTGKKLPREGLANLEVSGLATWAKRIEAAIALRSGRPQRALLLLESAMRETGDDPTVVFELALCRRALGLVAEERGLHAALHEELSVPRLDRPRLHPLARPTLAFVYRASGHAIGKSGEGAKPNRN